MMKFLPSTLLYGAILSAPALAQDPTLLWDVPGPLGENFGVSVAHAGDLNLDGHSDIVVGATGFNNFAGKVYAYSGADGSQLWSFDGLGPDDYMGAGICVLGDINRDGHPDIAAHASGVFNNGQNAGAIYLLSGLDGSVITFLKGDSGHWRFGSEMDSAGDVNNDGYIDLIMGAPAADVHGTATGVARVYSGENGAILYEFIGPAAWTEVGSAVAGAGDVDLDGYDDFIVGSESDDTFGDGRGVVRVYSGRTGVVLYEYVGAADFDFLGSSVDGDADANGDGIPDFVIGAKYTDVVADESGTVFVYSGADGSLLWQVEGLFVYNNFGRDACFGGDLNGDGFDDVLVGDYKGGYDGNINDYGPGYVWAYSGVDGSLLWRLDGDNDDDLFGIALSPAGDINADGADDLVIGAPAYTGTDLGYVRVFGGTASPHALDLATQLDLISGANSTSFVLNSTPGSLVTLFAGKGLGASFLPGFGQLDILSARPVLAELANVNGTARFNAWVSAGWAGLAVWVQAVDDLGETSNVQLRVIQ